MNRIRIGLYGGRFDPIHFGHLISARAVAESLNLARVMLIPAGRPPHKPAEQLTDANHRLAMARLAVEGDPLFEVSDVEVHRPGPSYTFDTVSHLKSQLDAELFWIIGADSLPELPTWHRIAELVNEVTLVTAARPGWKPPPLPLLASAVGDDAARRLLHDCIPTPEIGISATEIRARIAGGKSICYLVPENVRSYIQRCRLYTN